MHNRTMPLPGSSSPCAGRHWQNRCTCVLRISGMRCSVCAGRLPATVIAPSAIGIFQASSLSSRSTRGHWDSATPSVFHRNCFPGCLTESAGSTAGISRSVQSVRTTAIVSSSSNPLARWRWGPIWLLFRWSGRQGCGPPGPQIPFCHPRCLEMTGSRRVSTISCRRIKRV